MFKGSHGGSGCIVFITIQIITTSLTRDLSFAAAAADVDVPSAIAEPNHVRSQIPYGRDHLPFSEANSVLPLHTPLNISAVADLWESSCYAHYHHGTVASTCLSSVVVASVVVCWVLDVHVHVVAVAVADVGIVDVVLLPPSSNPSLSSPASPYCPFQPYQHQMHQAHLSSLYDYSHRHRHPHLSYSSSLATNSAALPVGTVAQHIAHRTSRVIVLRLIEISSAHLVIVTVSRGGNVWIVPVGSRVGMRR